MNQKIGIFGGTFNPVHNAHLRLAEQFLIELKLDKCIFVPANISPFKADYKSIQTTVASRHRLEMLKLALGTHQKISLDDFELNRGGISYSVNTINYLKQKYSKDDLLLFIGADQAFEFTKWRKWRDILKMTHICIALRESEQLDERLRRTLTYGIKIPIILKTPLIDISASMIRERLSKGESASNLLPNEVLNYIHKNNLYR